MRNQSDAELNKKKTAFASHLLDTCHIYHATMSSGTYGNDTESLIMVSGVACSFQVGNGQIQERGQLLLVNYDATLLLPADQPVRLSDEIQLVEKGNHLVSGTFRPNAEPMVNNTYQTVFLKRVRT
jgi:hypothetical protein